VLPVARGTYCLQVSTPFAIGNVNAYLLEGTPLTLIDGGPNRATGLVELEQLIEAAGHRLAEIELLLITHAHVDHEGLSGLIAERSGAEVACVDAVADYVRAFDENQRRDDRFAQDLMLRHGTETHVVDALGSVASVLVGFGSSVSATRRLADGELIEAGDRTLRILHRPGHSRGDTLFHDENAGVLFVGDHLLGEVSSNALVTRATEGDEHARTRPLLDYRRSLIATSELDVDVVLGGHGETINDHRTLIEKRLDAQRRKAERLHGLLADGPLSAHGLAAALYGNVAFSQAFLTLSEVLGHLDLLIEQGVVVEDDNGPVINFYAV
jgi:glyoxylase-like metal-dependent hydrolase (beta-lactamase superfamily II)